MKKVRIEKVRQHADIWIFLYSRAATRSDELEVFFFFLIAYEVYEGKKFTVGCR